jgi:similar to stage IV sporulation protein
MIIEYIWNLLIGYVIITVEGLSMEKLINLAALSDIKVWELSRTSYTHLTAKTTLIGYKKLKKIADDKYNIKVFKSKGITSEVRRLYLRKALFFGILVSLLIGFIISMFVWQIEIVGTNNLSKDTLLDEVYNMGLKTPVLKKNLNLEKIEDDIIIQHKEISWANFSYKGIKLHLEIVETSVPKSPKDPFISTNVVAKKDGYITKILVLEGEPSVTEGMTVKKDQTLIKGEYFDEKGNFRIYDAEGIVYADVWYMGEQSVPMFDEITIRTGRSTEAKYLMLGKSKGVINSGIKYDNYESEIESCIYLGENLAIPIKLVCEKKFETIKVSKRRDSDEIRNIAKNKAYETAFDKILFGTEIIKEKIVFSQKDDKIYASAFLKTNEDIAKKIINE